MFDLLNDDVPETAGPWLNPLTATGTPLDVGVGVAPGHQVYTVVAAMTLGLAVVLWRSRWRARRIGAPLLGFSGFVVAVASHASWNANFPPSGTERLEPAGAVAVFDTVWALTGRGAHLPLLAGVLFVVCLLVDVSRRSRAGHVRSGAGGAAIAAGVAPGGWDTESTAEQLVGKLRSGWNAAAQTARPSASATTPPAPTSTESESEPSRSDLRRDPARPQPVTGLGAAIALLVALVVRAGVQWSADVAFVLSAHCRQPGETRADSLLRGRAAVSLTRTMREEVMWATTPGVEPAARRIFAVAGAVAAVMIFAGSTVSAVAVARFADGLVDDPFGSYDAAKSAAFDGYLANLLDVLGDWWGGLGLGGQIAVGAGVAALIVLSGGSLAVAFGVSGVGTYGLTKARGLADLTRDPSGAARSYLATTTPLDLVVDTGEFALTFAPGNFAGAAGGRLARTAITEFADDPARYLATRRNLLRSAATNEAGVVDPAAFARRDPIRLADDSLHQALPANELDSLDTWVTEGTRRAETRTTPPYAYQRRLYGNDELLVATDPATWADGVTPAYGAIGDAKLVTGSRSFYVPESLGDPMAGWAMRDMDFRLAKYRAVILDSSNPVQVLEVATNNLSAARFIESRMRHLEIPGYVRIVP